MVWVVWVVWVLDPVEPPQPVRSATATMVSAALGVVITGIVQSGPVDLLTYVRRLACILLVLGLGGCGVAAGQGAAVHAVACHARGTAPFTLPDPGCTPGAVDPRVTQSDIATTICRSGYTRTVRPPESVTYREKRASMRAYGDHGATRRYEYDHLIPLELGGAPNDTRNLWPEPGATPNRKDRLESRLRRDVCAGRVTLAAARREIARNWVAAYRRLSG